MDKEFDTSEHIGLVSNDDTFDSIDSKDIKLSSVDLDSSFKSSLHEDIYKDTKSEVHKYYMTSEPVRCISNPLSEHFWQENYFKNNFHVPESRYDVNKLSGQVSQFELDRELDNFPCSVSFNGISLSGLSFKYRNLFSIEFRNCDLTNCDFSHCNLSNAHFIECKCDGAKFFNANCDSAWFHYCGLNTCDFSLANLSNCYFDRSHLSDADFHAVNFTFSNLFKPASLPKGFYRLSMNSPHLKDFIIDTCNDLVYLFNHVTLKGPFLLEQLKICLFNNIPESLKASSVYLDEAHLCYDIIEKIYSSSKKGSSSLSSNDSIDDIKNEVDLKSHSKCSDLRRFESKSLCQEKRKSFGIFDLFREVFNPKFNSNSLTDKKESINSQFYTSIDKKAILIAVTILTLIFMFSLLYGLLNGAPKGGF